MSAPDNKTSDKVVHVYDDIEEEDNHLPNWWLFILFATMVFSFGYWFVFHTTRALPTPPEVYSAEVAALQKKQALANPVSDEALLALSQDPSAVADGEKVFATTCVACHAQQGQGLVGPNLTDKFWIHGNKPADLLRAVMNGYPEKGMPPWGKALGDEKTRKVIAFVLSIKGKNLPGKAPQGEPME